MGGKFMPSMIHLRNTYKISGLCEARCCWSYIFARIWRITFKLGKFTNFKGAVSSSDDGHSLTGPYQNSKKKKRPRKGLFVKLIKTSVLIK